MADKAKRLNRILRVRSLQLGMVQAEESKAAARLAEERDLRDRIDQLAAGVAPIAATAPASAMSIMAAAHYRDRLHRTAVAVAERVDGATRVLDQAQSNTREAKRDEAAIEKLIDRATIDAAKRAMRALEELPPAPRKNRHDPC